MSDGMLQVRPLFEEKLENALPVLETHTAIKPGPRLASHTSEATSDVDVIGEGGLQVKPLLLEKLAKALLPVSCHVVKKPNIEPLTITAELTVCVFAMGTICHKIPCNEK